MGTRSFICIQKNNPDSYGISDGDIIGVYCHWDGYPSHNGKILKEHYTNIEQVEELISNGCMSSLGTDVLSTVFYARDKNEPFEGNKPFRVGFWRTNDNKPLFQEKQSYNYVFKDGKWFCYTGSMKEIEL